MPNATSGSVHLTAAQLSMLLEGIDPEAYLRYVIAHISEHHVNKVADLLPWHVAAILPRVAADDTNTVAIAA